MSNFFTSRPFQPKVGLPRGGGVKENTLPVKQQVGFELGTFWSADKNALTIWPERRSNMYHQKLQATKPELVII